MIERIIRLVLVIIIPAVMTMACSTEKPADTQVIDEAIDDTFLSRPRLDRPQGRPLGRVLITWNGIDGAEGYEIQMSERESFDVVLKNWTISGRNLELPIESGAVLWFRIRAFDSRTTSRWSSALKIEEQLL